MFFPNGIHVVLGIVCVDCLLCSNNKDEPTIGTEYFVPFTLIRYMPFHKIGGYLQSQECSQNSFGLSDLSALEKLNFNTHWFGFSTTDYETGPGPVCAAHRPGNMYVKR